MRRTKKKKIIARVPLMSIEERVVLLPLEEYESMQDASKKWTGEEDFFAVCFDDGEGYRPITKTFTDVYSNNKVAFFPLFQMPGSAEAFARDRRIHLKSKLSTSKLTKFKVVRGTLDDFKMILEYLESKNIKFDMQINMAIVWPYQEKGLAHQAEEVQVLDIVDQLYLN